jgi:eukaryotic-like serine/threonine-protein kinase
MTLVIPLKRRFRNRLFHGTLNFALDSFPAHTWFGLYRLSSRLGTGGMAEVFAGRRKNEVDGTLGHLVAVKRLLPHLAKDKHIVRMFLNEARVTAQIKHDNVVKIFELGDVDGEPFIAMELLDGRTWAELRDFEAERAKRMPLRIAMRVLSEACRGLDAAHRATTEEGQPLALVHRDFTPENIHVGAEGDIKVIDFGIAKTTPWSMGTEPGTLKGKFFYMSPEMILCRPVDHRADIFAAGVMLYEQLCGRRPFTGSTVNDVVARIAAGNATPPSVFDPSIPVRLEAISLKALNHEPGLRFQSLAEFAQAIESIDEEHLADAFDVKSYLAELFLSQEEIKKATFVKALEADPSIPNLRIVPEPQKTVERKPESIAGARPSSALRWSLGLALVAALGGVGYVKYAEVNWRAWMTWPSGNTAATPQNDGFEDLIEEASVALKARNAKRTETILSKAEQVRPGDVRVDDLRAQLKEAQGDLTGAVFSLSKALEKAPEQADFLVRQGVLLSLSGRLDEAAPVLQRALKKAFSAKAAAELGFVYLRQNKLGDAQNKLEAALKVEPDNASAHYYLGSVFFQRGQSKRAKEAFEKAISLDATDTRFWLALCTASGVESVRARMQKQFPEDAPKLLSRCESEAQP